MNSGELGAIVTGLVLMAYGIYIIYKTKHSH
ncbi:hypothetical protein SAMN05216234_13915 [Hydrogenimonas thermophila]|uniref:Uncharacterized protein n=1 Tax=Hydrogenimonas thermophila TaxID=223786 RepID=A0A1I5T121_9BACT|nr:hypothetical protein SAMN05216234_13915 [Hydrogenimonas thermophila]